MSPSFFPAKEIPFHSFRVFQYKSHDPVSDISVSLVTTFFFFSTCSMSITETEESVTGPALSAKPDPWSPVCFIMVPTIRFSF